MGLNELRENIDRIDEALVRLLKERARTARRIGEEKLKESCPVRNPEREQDVLSHVRALNDVFSEERIEAIFRAIIDGCTEVQVRERPGA